MFVRNFPLNWGIFFINFEKMNSNDIGCYSEYRIACALMSQGYKISMPLNDSSVYDMIVDSGSKLYKIQIKGTTRKPQGNRRGVQVNITRNRKYSKTEIDFYLIWVEYYKGYFFLKNENQSAVNLHPFGKYKQNFNTFVIQ